MFKMGYLIWRKQNVKKKQKTAEVFHRLRTKQKLNHILFGVLPNFYGRSHKLIDPQRNSHYNRQISHNECIT